MEWRVCQFLAQKDSMPQSLVEQRATQWPLRRFIHVTLVPILAGRNGSTLVGHVSTGKMDSQDKCVLDSIENLILYHPVA